MYNALSIRQPYAFAVVNGYKPPENRNWPTDYRGWLLIHAGKTEEKDDVEGVLRTISQQEGIPLEELRQRYETEKGLGCIVGCAYLSDCVTAMDSTWFYGPYGFVMTQAKPIPGQPIPFKGRRGFFQVPDKALESLKQ